jgi:hypothetical protein
VRFQRRHPALGSDGGEGLDLDAEAGVDQNTCASASSLARVPSASSGTWARHGDEAAAEGDSVAVSVDGRQSGRSDEMFLRGFPPVRDNGIIISEISYRIRVRVARDPDSGSAEHISGIYLPTVVRGVERSAIGGLIFLVYPIVTWSVSC